ncbi:MAG: NAD kinase [Saprospiraceae bacterium]
MKILIYSQIYKPKDRPYVETLIDAIRQENISLMVYQPYADAIIKDSLLEGVSYDTIADYQELILKKPDMVVTLGGDGTILRAIDLVRDSRVPILGVNLGRLGFLSSIEKSKIREAISGLLNGQYYTDERSMLSLTCNIPIFTDLPYALNDFTLHKRDTSSMITIHTYVNGDFLNSYWADGIVVATATGSTGYSLSCGGPIIFPTSGNIVITPVAPHNLNVRPIVLSDDSEITLEVEGRSENFLCTLDSRFETVTSDYKIKIKKCDFPILLAHPKEITFMKTIREKLMWGLDKRNH